MSQMTIENAKPIHSLVMKALMAQQGIGECSDDDVNKLKEIKLIDMLKANELMTGYKEQTPTGTRHTMHTTDEAIAELFCRLQSSEFFTLEDVQSLAEAYEQVVQDSDNGFAVVIDSSRYFTLVALNSDGTAGEDVHYEHSFSALYNWVAGKISEVEE